MPEALGRRSWPLLLLGALSLGMMGCSERSRSGVILGAVLPLSGQYAPWGTLSQQGIEMAITEVNERGGIAGQKVQALYRDSQGSPHLATAALADLVHLRVAAVVGDILSPPTLAMARFAEMNQTVLVTPAATAPELANAGRYTFQVWPPDRLQAETAAEWVLRKGWSKAGLLAMQNAHGDTLAGFLRNRFEAMGGTIVVAEAYLPDHLDFRPLLLRVGRARPDVVFLIGDAFEAATVLRQARELGMPDKFVAARVVASEQLLAAAGPAAEGLVWPVSTGFDPAAPTPPQTAFITKYLNRFGQEPEEISAYSHDAAMILLKALEAGARTGEEIRAYLDGGREMTGVTGRMIFDRNGDAIRRPVVFKTVQGGRVVSLGSL